MSTPQSTPMKHVKLGIASAKSLPLTSEFKKLLSDQHQRLSLKHQQDLDLIDDIRGYVKARLAIERDYTNALQKLAKQHSSHINKKFALLHQLDQDSSLASGREHALQASSCETNRANAPNIATGGGGGSGNHDKSSGGTLTVHHSHQEQPSKASSLYKVWSDHINCLANTAKNRADQFEQSNLIVDKLKDIRQHKASIGKKCLDTHLKRIQEEVLLSMVDVERAKKLYYEDESQAKKARENEERIKKKRSGLLTKFTDLQAKKEKSSAQREATDIQSTQARNDYIMALAAANSHLNYYYYRDLNDFIQLIDDGVLDHCKIFMATLSECDINSLKDSLSHAQYWSKLINLTGSQQTNQIFLDCEQSVCLKDKQELHFEPCNNDPISKISLEHNADYALQHEIDKWFTWFKKECRNLSQLMHQLDTCQHAFAEGKKSVEFNGQTIDDLEPKIIELKQQIRKCEAAKLKAQARLKAIKEGGMQIEEWNSVELEIRADMARAQEEQERARRLRELEKSMDDSQAGHLEGAGVSFDEPAGALHQDAQDVAHHPAGGQNLATSSSIHLQVSRDSDDSDGQNESIHNLASVSRSTSNLLHKQQQAISGYSALTDPSLVWQDDYSAAWGGESATGGHTTDRAGGQPSTVVKSPTSPRPSEFDSSQGQEFGFQAQQQQQDQQQDKLQQVQHIPNASMSIQSSSPLSAIVNGGQHLSQSPYQGIMSEAYKSDYECDYSRSGHHTIRSAASSVEPTNHHAAGHQLRQQQDVGHAVTKEEEFYEGEADETNDVAKMLNRQVVALYRFERTNEDDLEFDENDLLEVIEINPSDTNWVKARRTADGREGYIPSSYVRLHETDEQQPQHQQQPPSAWSSSLHGGTDARAQGASSFTEKDNFDEPAHAAQEQVPEILYCRALYDYKPDADTLDEEDGLPHLSLAQGELMQIVDQGEDDGWWLVEKTETGTRGHVPSMLVQELDPNEEEDDDEEEGEDVDYEDEGDLSDEVPEHDGPPPQGPPPTIEAPILDAAPPSPPGDEQVAEEPLEPREAPPVGAHAKEQTSNSLIPTSFIIIEPTPEVESRRFEDALSQGDEEVAEKDDGAKSKTRGEAREENAQESLNDSTGTRQVVRSQPAQSSQVSYSVVNEDFVLERPTRRPQQGQQQASADAVAVTTEIHHHVHHNLTGGPHEPTISEDEEGEQQQQQEIKEGTMEHEIDDENQYEVDSNRPAPPSVVIDSVEAIPRSPDLSFEDEHNDDQSAHSSSQHDQTSEGADSTSQTAESQQQPERKQIKHTGYVDVSPILRHHADEFTKQLIEEAIMLAPGSRIGPSTSSADMQRDEDGGSDEDYTTRDGNNNNLSMDDSA